MKAYDPLPLIERLIQHRVEFVIVGGVAATLQGAELPTTDLDVMYSRDRQNLANLATALQSLAVRLRGAEELNLTVDAILLRNGDAFTFATSLGDFDVMATATGAPMYDELAKRATVFPMATYQVKVASLDDLIAMKRTTGRAKDVPKLAELLELRKLVQESE
jgi:hypothetical protein